MVGRGDTTPFGIVSGLMRQLQKNMGPLLFKKSCKENTVQKVMHNAS
jgi:hypothetical protein